MDIEAALADLRAALKLLPPDMVKQLFQAIFSNILPLTMAWPRLRNLLEPHVKAAMVAYPAGMIDMDALQKGVQDIINEVING